VNAYEDASKAKAPIILSDRWCSGADDSHSRLQRGVSDAVGGRNNLVIHVHGWSRSRFLHVILQLGNHSHLYRRFSC